MIVEFMGLPGSGKTTLTGALIDHLNKQAWQRVFLEQLETRNKRIKPLLQNNPVARHNFRRDQLYAEFPDFMAACDDVLAPVPLQKAMFLDCLTKYLIKRDMPRQIGLIPLHEGAWHRLIYAINRQPETSKRDFLNNLPKFPMPGAVVMLNSEPKRSIHAVAERMSNRGVRNPHEKAISTHGDAVAQQRRLDQMRGVIAKFKELGGNAIELNAYEPIDAMVQTLASSLNVSQLKKTYA